MTARTEYRSHKVCFKTSVGMSVGQKVLTTTMVDASESLAKQATTGEGVSMSKTLTDVISNGIAGKV